MAFTVSNYTCIACRIRHLRLAALRRSFCRSVHRQKDVTPDFVDEVEAAHAELKARRQDLARPSIAPKPKIDLAAIRKDPDLYSRNAVARNYSRLKDHPSRILALHQELAKLQRDATEPRRRLNHLEKQLGILSRQRENSGGAAGEKDALLQEARLIRESLSAAEAQEAQLHATSQELALGLPNLTSTVTPTGTEPVIVGYINSHPDEQPEKTTNKSSMSHVDIGRELDLLDFTSASTTTGWGFYYLRNAAALLEQALIQYALSVAMRRGWTPVTPPSVVYSHIAAACGFQPRDANDEQQIWSIQPSARDANKPPRSLAATAEIPLAAIHANQTLNANSLPMKYVGPSRCYRAEAGARGVDTKGLYRVHEFTKVEMFGWTFPDEVSADAGGKAGSSSHSETLFNELLDIQSEILTGLGLHCRILEMPSMDLGASAFRKRDIEAFFPSRRDRDDGWGEVTSASICTDYQSRRLGTKIEGQASLGRKKGGSEWPHTVNGTAVAVPRVLAALLESGWDDKARCVWIPPVLRNWMGGLERIERR